MTMTSTTLLCMLVKVPLFVLKLLPDRSLRVPIYSRVRKDKHSLFT